MGGTETPAHPDEQGMLLFCYSFHMQEDLTNSTIKAISPKGNLKWLDSSQATKLFKTIKNVNYKEKIKLYATS